MSAMKLIDFQEEGTEYLKRKLNYLETSNVNKTAIDLYRGINKFCEGHQRKTNLERGDKGHLPSDSHRILDKRKNHFCWL
jgi:hypothetical protein